MTGYSGTSLPKKLGIKPNYRAAFLDLPAEVKAELRDAHKCGGDITNHEGKLQCVPIRRMEKR